LAFAGKFFLKISLKLTFFGLLEQKKQQQKQQLEQSIGKIGI
jgi:hypothetical protein